MLSQDIKDLLLTRHYLISEKENITEEANYLNAYLFINFGIVLDKPLYINKDIIKSISDLFFLQVPKSFYSNPQDTKFFNSDELLLEQIISYFAYGSDLGRLEIFKKNLPVYKDSNDFKLRTFYIITEEATNDILKGIMNNFCSYTRPFSKEELEEFICLYKNNYYDFSTEIKCKDNIFALLPLNNLFASFIDKKDIVKLSISKFGEHSTFAESIKNTHSSELQKISTYLPYVKSCPLSKKQAKYFNKIVSLCNSINKTGKNYIKKETNSLSPDKLARKFIIENDPVSAAKVYAANGSMLERRIKMLLARSTPDQAIKILDLLSSKNPIALYQLMVMLSEDSLAPRTFTYFHDNKVKVHTETDYEAKYRKSRLNDATNKLLQDVCKQKIIAYYSNKRTSSKFYIADNFYKLALPINTSSNSKGIDVIPTGSRLTCAFDKIRTFVHWKNAFDIDSSLIVVDKNDKITTCGWFNYQTKYFGDAILYSGDITSRNGAEYFDIDLSALEDLGYKYIIQTFHGYRDKLNAGEIYTGYQVKQDFHTKAWDPKNIEMQFKVNGDSRSCIAFAIDIKKRETVIINLILDSDERVVTPEGFKPIKKFLSEDYLNINIGNVAECLGQRVENPAEADIILDDIYMPSAERDVSTQKIIRSFDLEKLVALIK